MIGRFGVPALVVAALTTAVPAEAAVSLKASAGLGGLVRPGRWTPIRVVVESDGDDRAAELTAQWGDAIVRRAVTLPSPARREYELYIRTADVRDVIVVRLQAGGAELGRVDAPVRIVGSDEPVTLCVASASRPSAAKPCAASLAAEELPRSPRGFDAVDRVVWEAVDAGALPRDQRDAFDVWQAARLAGKESDAPALTPGAVHVAEAWGHRLRTSTIAYVFCLFATVVMFHRRSRTLALYPAIVIMAVLGCATGVAAGRIGPHTSLVIHHSSLLQQFAGASGALVAMRGVAEYPTFGEYAVRARTADASIDVRRGQGLPSEERLDEDGFPLLSGVFGLGATTAFALEGTSPSRVLDVSSRAGRTRISNASPFDLHDCRFSQGFSADAVADITPGAVVEAQQLERGNDPTFTCRFAGSPVDFVEQRRRVTTEGETVVVYHLAAVDNDHGQNYQGH